MDYNCVKEALLGVLQQVLECRSLGDGIVMSRFALVPVDSDWFPISVGTQFGV